MGDVFYDEVAMRVDPMIDQWKRETSYEEKPMTEDDTPQPMFVRGNAPRLPAVLPAGRGRPRRGQCRSRGDGPDLRDEPLAMIRKAAKMTRVEVAEKLGIGQDDYLTGVVDAPGGNAFRSMHGSTPGRTRPRRNARNLPSLTENWITAYPMEIFRCSLFP
jgi:hypothetical protein